MTQLTYKVLIADDEERIRKLIRMYMELEQAIVEETDNGEQALMMAIDTDYDLIIMDWLMPGLSGLEVCQMLKSIKNTPIILLTARSDEADRILGFQAGADDYVCKPFSPRELLLRAKAILKRTIPEQFWIPAPIPSGQIVFTNLIIDHHARRVLVEGEEIYLTLKEYELLRYFSLHIGKICTRELLLMEIWNYEEYGDHRTVDTHVKRLRDKMHKVSPTAASMIRTVWGTGYRMDDIT
ncbi:response regulator transcription factor [Paenibacillus sp. FSL H7-0331]|uniref:response regulator transcription factor n=1 Tax=Paenibacillus sp. FSL H7-0331 TaxID=1920421 RepID=UPI00096DC434|nr:response regulator transcription factor [Paenibacillus sp. FSL H7-0331]OME99252.1 DNA-binding response regulator [Paenibacillus sp. FSL H7-0331]